MNIFKFHFTTQRLHQSFLVLFFAALYATLVYFGKDKLYWECMRSPMFRYSVDYFIENWAITKDPMFFVYQFLLQFFFYPYLGALILIGCYILLYVFIKRVLVQVEFNALFAHYLVLSLLVVFQWWMFNLLFGFFLLIPVTIFYGVFALYPFFKKTWARIIFCITALLFLTFFIGPSILGFQGNIWLWSLVCLPFVLAVAKSIIPQISILCKKITGVGIFVITLCFTIFSACTNKSFKLLNLYYETERHIEDKDWNAALSDCNTYLELTEFDEDKGMYYPWMSDNTKFALCLTGRLLDDFFNYGKYAGFQNLFPMELDILDRKHFGLYSFFSDIGLQSQAITSAFMQTASFNRGDPRALNALIRSCFIVRDYRPVMLYINLLDESLVFKKQAQAFRKLYNDTTLIEKDPFYTNSRQLIFKTDFRNSWGIDYSIANLYRSNPSNQRAYEYALTTWLTYKQLNLVTEEIKHLKTFNYKRLPRCIEEALLIFLHYGDDPEMTQRKILSMDFGGFQIRRETLYRCGEFFRMLQALNKGEISEQLLYERFGDSYWYYYLFIPIQSLQPLDSKSYAI